MSLKRTPISRPTGAELVERISRETEGLPPTRVAPKPQAEPLPATAGPDLGRPSSQSMATEQINFRGSPGLARLLAQLAAEQGSIRLVVARLLVNQGHQVPEADLLPPPGRRRL